MRENSVLANLEPKNVLRFFEELCALPHGSGNTAAASDWAVAFAKKRGLRHRRDEAGNVVIWKDASPGYEDHPAVMLQGHLDMVCAADPDVKHDFTKDGLELVVDGDWIKARGTTLGGDDGIAVAMAMAALDDDSLPHPPLEAVFTVDEEIGLLGATALDCSDLKSRYLLNIDSEAEGVLTVGCAGGARCDIVIKITEENEKEYWKWTKGGRDIYSYTLSLEGFTGGHSGTEIHKGYANPIKLLAECLLELGCPHIYCLRGGTQDNAIPQSASVCVFVRDEKEGLILRDRAKAWAEKKKAACPMDPGFTLRWEFDGKVNSCLVLRRSATRKIVWMILDAPNGVLAMNPDLPDQVQTSLNLGIATVGYSRTLEYRLSFSIRSSVAEEKEQVARQLKALASAHGVEFSRRGDYPAWEYRKDSPLRDTMAEVFKEQYGREPKVETIHAGLECGILTSKMPGLDAVSIGPDLVDIHTPRERASISSIQRTWAFLTAVLARL